MSTIRTVTPDGCPVEIDLVEDGPDDVDTTTGITGEIGGRLERILDLVEREPGLLLCEFAARCGYVDGERHRLGFVVRDALEESGINPGVAYGWLVISHDGKVYRGARTE